MNITELTDRLRARSDDPLALEAAEGLEHVAKQRAVARAVLWHLFRKYNGTFGAEGALSVEDLERIRDGINGAEAEPKPDWRLSQSTPPELMNASRYVRETMAQLGIKEINGIKLV